MIKYFVAVLVALMIGLLNVSTASTTPSKATGYRNVPHAVVVEALTTINGGVSASLWAPDTVLAFADPVMPDVSAVVEMNQSAYDVELYPTDRHYSVNHMPSGFERAPAMIGDWGAYAHGRPASEWVSLNVSRIKWPCSTGHNCRGAGTIKISGSLSGLVWKTDEGLSDITWTMGTWRIRCNAWPGPSTETALLLAQRLLKRMRDYPLPKVAGTLSLYQGADGNPTIATWNDGGSLVYVWGINPELAVPIISSMRRFQGGSKRPGGISLSPDPRRGTFTE
jgi:hypothetical protein